MRARPVPARAGDYGDDIALAQKILGVAPADGGFCVATEARLRGWQWTHGLPVTGVLDEVTCAALTREEPR